MEFQSTSELVENLRLIKDRDEIAQIVLSVDEMSEDEVLQALSDEDIDREIERMAAAGVKAKSDGSPDPARVTIYTGDAQIMTNMGALPVSFDIEANNLAEAVANYGEAAKAGIERTMRELQELRRQQSSGLIVPPAGAANALTGGGFPGGGKIQMP